MIQEGPSKYTTAMYKQLLADLNKRLIQLDGDRTLSSYAKSAKKAEVKRTIKLIVNYENSAVQNARDSQ